MPRKGPAYQISKQWQSNVLTRLDEMGISQNELARRAKISKASLSEALADGAVQSTVMPEIHKALGWPEPELVVHPDRLELLALWDQMSDFDKGQHLESLRNKIAVSRKRRN